MSIAGDTTLATGGAGFMGSTRALLYWQPRTSIDRGFRMMPNRVAGPASALLEAAE